MIGSADVARLNARIRALGNGAMVVTVVGQTFHGSLAPAPIDQTPKRTPANVTQGTSAALDLLREKQREGAVPADGADRDRALVLASTVRSRSVSTGSTASTASTRRSGSSTGSAAATSYWGVEETDWKDAPSSTTRASPGGSRARVYSLYYNGPHLHMVVIRRGKATYWVVNSLLDELSNETMLAIAKGLRPINAVEVSFVRLRRNGLRSSAPAMSASSPGACFAQLGHDVVVRDIDEARIEALQAGRGPDLRAGCSTRCSSERERIRFTTDVADAVEAAEFVYVAVGTPPTYSGDADLSRSGRSSTSCRRSTGGSSS